MKLETDCQVCMSLVLDREKGNYKVVDLKVLDLMNIKSLPTQYVLKRWTREARSGTIHDSKG